MGVKLYKTYNLSKNKIENICKLKSSFWKFSITQQKNWFKKNIAYNDLHFCYETSRKILGYNSLKKKNFLFKKKKINYFLFDTFIINKKFRNQGISKKIMNKNISFLKKNEKIGILQCEIKHIKFYKKLGWSLLKNNKSIRIKVRRKMKIMFVNFSLINFVN